MKIKISKAQWNALGESHGWIRSKDFDKEVYDKERRESPIALV